MSTNKNMKRGLIIGLILVSLVLVTGISGCLEKDTSKEENCALMKDPTSEKEGCFGTSNGLSVDPPRDWVVIGKCTCGF